MAYAQARSHGKTSWDALKQLGVTRLVSEPNVYRNAQQTVFVMVYVDDL